MVQAQVSSGSEICGPADDSSSIFISIASVAALGETSGGDPADLHAATRTFRR